MICKYFDPPVASGMPRTVMFALPSPPEDSERMPGRLRKSSSVERGATWNTLSTSTELVEMLESRRLTGRPTAVTTTSCSSSLAALGGALASAAAVLVTIAGMLPNTAMQQLTSRLSDRRFGDFIVAPPERILLLTQPTRAPPAALVCKADLN